MFKLFGQIQNNIGLNQNGIGLGLVIIKKIVNQFGGEINFESQYEVGSVFTVTFKLENENQQREFEYIQS